MRVLYTGVLGELGGVNDAWQSEIEKAAIRYVSGEKSGAASFAEEVYVIVKLPAANNAMKSILKVTMPPL